MVPGDSERAARRTGSMFPPKRVSQYYDSERVVGSAFIRGPFRGCLDQALRATPANHPLHEALVEWSQSGQPEHPLWDAVLFYPPGIEWIDTAPAPLFWSKQVGFFGSDAGEVTGTFFRDGCDQPPIDSSWPAEARQALERLTQAREARTGG